MSGDDLDPADWETYPGERARYEELDAAANDPVPTDDIDWSVFEGADGSVIAPPPEQGVSISGLQQGAIWADQSIRVGYVDTSPGVDHLGQPVRQITGTITTSGGHTQSVTLHLSGFENGIATYASRPINSAGGVGVDRLPLEVGETVNVQVSASSASIDHIFEHPHEAKLHALRTELEQAGIFMADLLRAYRAMTEGGHDVPMVALNLQILEQGVRTAQLGLEHFDDPGSHVVRIARAEYYLSHIGLNQGNLQALLEGKHAMRSPYDDDIRDTVTLKNDDSMLSFYMNDVVIHEHFDTLVEDAEGWAEHKKDAAIGESFDASVKGLLRGSYDALVGQSGVGAWYPILDLAFTGEGRDHMGKALKASDWTGVAIGMAWSAASKTKSIVDGPSPPKGFTSSVKKWGVDKINGKIKDGTVKGLGAGVEYIYNLQAAEVRPPDADPNAGPPPTPLAPEPQPTPTQQPFWATGKAKAGAAAIGVIGAIGGGYVLTQESGEPPPPAPAQIIFGDDEAAVDADPPVANDETDDAPEKPPSPIQEPDSLPFEPVGFGTITLPNRPPGSGDTPEVGDPLAERLKSPHPQMTDTDDTNRQGGGSLWVETTWVLDWQGDIYIDTDDLDARIGLGGFQPGAKYDQELIIMADCTDTSCVYTHEARAAVPPNPGETEGLPALEITFTAEKTRGALFEEQGILYGSVEDTSGGCDRTIFIALRVSDWQTIRATPVSRARLVPDRIDGGRIEYGTCVEEVYREISYEGGYKFQGSYADQ